MFRSKYKNGKNYVIQKNDLHKGPIVSVNAVLIIPLKAEDFLAVSEKSIKFIFFSKISTFIFPHYVPMDAKNAVITTSPAGF